MEVCHLPSLLWCHNFVCLRNHVLGLLPTHPLTQCHKISSFFFGRLPLVDDWKLVDAWTLGTIGKFFLNPLIHTLLIIAKTSIFVFKKWLKLLWNKGRGSQIFWDSSHNVWNFFYIFLLASHNRIYICPNCDFSLCTSISWTLSLSLLGILKRVLVNLLETHPVKNFQLSCVVKVCKNQLKFPRLE